MPKRSALKVTITPRAQTDLRNIKRYIMRGNPHRALSFVSELRAHIRGLADFPDKGAKRDYLRLGLRMLAHGQYLIYYCMHGHDVRVERVLHAARHVEGAFN
jgi:toxin ParE1/3/4